MLETMNEDDKKDLFAWFDEYVWPFSFGDVTEIFP